LLYANCFDTSDQLSYHQASKIVQEVWDRSRPYNEKLDLNFQEADLSVDLIVRVHTNTLDSIDEHGLRNLFQTGTSSGQEHNNAQQYQIDRRISEGLLVDDRALTSVADARAIYSYVRINGLDKYNIGQAYIMSPQYGDIELIMKDEIKSQATLFLGDSLSLGAEPFHGIMRIARPVNDLRFIRAAMTTFFPSRFSKITFIEGQIWPKEKKGTSLADVKQVRISRKEDYLLDNASFSSPEKLEKSYNRLLNKLKKLSDKYGFDIAVRTLTRKLVKEEAPKPDINRARKYQTTDLWDTQVIYHPKAKEFASSYNKYSVASLIEKFQNSRVSYYEKNIILDRIGQSRTKTGRDFLIRQLGKENDKKTKIQIVQSLMYYQDAEVTPTIKSLLRSPDADLRYLALTWLGEFKDIRLFNDEIYQFEHNDYMYVLERLPVLLEKHPSRRNVKILFNIIEQASKVSPVDLTYGRRSSDPSARVLVECFESLINIGNSNDLDRLIEIIPSLRFEKSSEKTILYTLKNLKKNSSKGKPYQISRSLFYDGNIDGKGELKY